MRLNNSRLHSAPNTKWIVPWLAFLSLLGIWPALTNGQPFFYSDTTAYVRGADLAISKALGGRFATEWAKDQRRMIAPEIVTTSSGTASADTKSSRRVVLAGRSIIYGVLLYMGEIFGGMWFSIFIQSMVAAYLIFLFIVKTLGLAFRYFLITCAVLFIASPLPFVASFLMPDVFAGILILGFAILATSLDRLARFEVAFTAGVILFAVLTHTTHLVLLLGLTAITACCAFIGKHAPRMNIRWLASFALACLAVAIAWEFLFSFAVNRAFGSPPVRPPFVTAKLVSMLGEPAVSRACGANTFVVCRFQDRAPFDNDRFLWAEDERTGVFSAVDSGTKRSLDNEQFRFALAMVPPNLGRLLSGLSVDALRQLTHVGLEEYSYGPVEIAFSRDHLPNHYFETLKSALAARSDAYVLFGRRVLELSALIASIMLAFALIHAARMKHSASNNRQFTVWRTSIFILLTGIVLNAIVCGGLSAVHDRYQARVIWLVQLAAVTGICLLANASQGSLRHGRREAAQRPPDAINGR